MFLHLNMIKKQAIE